MTTAIIDTNAYVQYLISPPRSASVRTIETYYAGRFRHVYSWETLDELLELLLLPRMLALHGLTENEILDYVASLLINADRFTGGARVSDQLTRDVTDTKFLTLAVDSQADFLVTNDRRHLLPLKVFGQTQIVTPTQFLQRLRRS